MAPPAEISIPTTSTSQPDASSNSKPFTLYNITLRLPLRSFVVQKRYSDFVALHAQLTSLVGSPPPAPLPKKSWFKSTVSSPELTEQRRVQLEAYLRAIAEPPDRRWRDTSAWRAFLNLPGGGGGASASQASASGVSLDYRAAAARLPAIGLKENNLIAASHPTTWLDLHREMQGALHEARKALGRRDNATENGTRIEAGAAAKRELIKAGSLLVALGEGLKVLKEQGKIGEGEHRRRGDLLNTARNKRDELERDISSLAGFQSGREGDGGDGGQGTAGTATAGSSGFGAGASRFGGGRVLGAPLPETDKTRELDNDGVLQLQRNILNEQESDVEALARIVRRQKEMGLAIDDEVRRHIDLLNGLDQDVDVLGKKMVVANTRDGEEEEEEVQHDGASSAGGSVSVSRSVSPSDSGYEEEEVELESEEEKGSKIEDVGVDANTKEEVMVPETETDLLEDGDELRGMGGGRTVGEGVGGVVVVRDNGDAANGGITDAVLLLIVRCVLTGMHGFVVLKWILGKVSEGLAWVVELGMLLLGQPPP
ncbi:hypothetical protein QBC37DRAFT_294002 [Rhypophila decipiens]|uniref:PX domain-containing protein n=1 Tax=Rhypophila decipiens TaxID=261697 RepID=A0AAN7B1X1_9PEZI|nr:hypothetical protein QBC37DRAFT_294002 [Rhypophila decipiens]